MSVPLEKVAVLGTGLIGGSLAGAMRARGMARTVVGMGRGRDNLELAREKGLIDRASTDLAEAVAGAELIVLAAPADHCVQLLAALAGLGPALRADAVLTDAASVKRTLVEAAAAAGLAERFVGAHPMAGGTSSGAGAADASLFEGRLVVMTPERADAAAVATVRALWEGVGARVIETSAARHDRLVARVSHLPQTLAWVLAATVGGDAERDALVEVAASGLRDMTRLAASDFDMWRAILAANRDEVSAALDAFCEVLTALRTAVERGDEAALDELVGRARALREDLDS